MQQDEHAVAAGLGWTVVVSLETGDFNDLRLQVHSQCGGPMCPPAPTPQRDADLQCWEGRKPGSGAFGGGGRLPAPRLC